MPDPRPLYERALAQTAELIEAAPVERLGDPTPCEEYDIRALLGHVIGVTQLLVSAGEGDAGEGDAGEEPPEQAAEVPDDGWPTVFDAIRKRVLAAWVDDAKLDTVMAMPWGKVPGRVAVSGLVMETVAHNWDIAQALGQPIALDAELGEFALGMAQQALPAEREEGSPFGTVRPVAEDADVYTRLAAWLGRTV